MAKLYGVLANDRAMNKSYTSNHAISSTLKTRQTTVDTNIHADGTTWITIKRGEETVYLTIASEQCVAGGRLNPVLEQSNKITPVTTLYSNTNGSK